MYFDFHTHLDFYKDEEISEVLDLIISERIKCFSASVNIESFKRNLKIKEMLSKKESLENLIEVGFGVHPSFCKNLPEKENEAVNLLSPYYEKSDIISEIGLDFFWEKECPKAKQILHFLIALENAENNNKICVIHTKGAEKEVYDILKDFPHAKPVIHWYDGPVEIYKKFLSKGYYQTFGCELKYSESIKNFLKMTPLELLLPETDNPTGEIWLGGTDDTPGLINRVYKDISEVTGKTEEEIENILERNLNNLRLK